jgi:hypothetical protein
MKGTIVVIAPNLPPKLTHTTAAPDLDVLKGAVGGYIELVPYFTSIEWPRDGVRRACVAFCNEDGKRLKLSRNTLADLFWHEAWVRDPISIALRSLSPAPDFLVGTVVVLYGDSEFMSEL